MVIVPIQVPMMVLVQFLVKLMILLKPACNMPLPARNGMAFPIKTPEDIVRISRVVRGSELAHMLPFSHRIPLQVEKGEKEVSRAPCQEKKPQGQEWSDPDMQHMPV